MLVANDVTVLVDAADRYTPTPAVSHAILRANGGRTTGAGLADGIVVTPSHNPPSDGGFKYNPPHGGPADTDATGWIAGAGQRAARRRADRRAGGCRSPPPAPPSAAYDFLGTYVDDLPNVVDIDAIRDAGVRIGADPLGGASVDYWARDRRAPPPRPHRRQPARRPDVALHDARLGRQDPHGLLVARTPWPR